mgnify:FL=1
MRSNETLRARVETRVSPVPAAQRVSGSVCGDDDEVVQDRRRTEGDDERDVVDIVAAPKQPRQDECETELGNQPSAYPRSKADC